MSSPAPTESHRDSWLTVFLAFLRHGLTSFGGPVAHLGYFGGEFVARRKWLDEAAYTDIIALCQFLPGPASSQVGITIGILRAGLPGAFAAWLGLTPRERSTGGKHRLGRISKAGNERLRQLLVVGATSVIRVARPGRPSSSTWLLGLLARKPKKLAAVALANKIARIIWAMMARGEAYRRRPIVT